MSNKIFVQSMMILLFLKCINSDPIIIRSGVSKNKGEEQNANIFDSVQHKGISNYEGEEGFNKNNEQKSVQAQDKGHYDEEAANKKQHLDQNNFADEKFIQNDGGHVSDFGNKEAHKKGHHKSGYHNSYHKDETGSNSSYYDDSDDQGDEYVRNTKKGTYNDANQSRQQGGNFDSQHYAQDHGKHGHYNNAGNYEKDLANRQGYNRNNYYDERENQGRRNAADVYGTGEQFAKEQFIERQPHFIPHHQYDLPQGYYGDDLYYNRPPPVPVYQPKKRITVYEDPRYYDEGLDYQRYYNDPRYNNDYVQIEVKKPLGYQDYRYRDRRPYY